MKNKTPGRAVGILMLLFLALLSVPANALSDTAKRIPAGFLLVDQAEGKSPKKDFEVEVPKQVIQGAESPIAKGDLVDLTISEIDRKPPFYISSDYQWKVFDNGKEKKVRKAENGVFFGAGIEDKRFLVFCVATHLYGKKDDKGGLTDVTFRTVFLSADVQVGTPGPGPNPNPNPPGPGPTPEPDFPDGKYKLSKFVWRSVALKVANGKAKTDGAAALRASFDGIAAAVVAGTISDPKEILTKTKDANNKAVERVGATEAWMEWAKDLQKELFRLYDAGQLKTKDDFVTAWREISLALSKVQ